MRFKVGDKVKTVYQANMSNPMSNILINREGVIMRILDIETHDYPYKVLLKGNEDSEEFAGDELILIDDKMRKLKEKLLR